MSIKRNAALLLIMSFISGASSAALSVGAGAVFNESIYRGYNENTHAVPIVNYEGDSFYIRQTTLGYAFFKNQRDEVSLTVSWLPLTFDPSDNDDSAMKQLDKRNSTAMAEIGRAHV